MPGQLGEPEELRPCVLGWPLVGRAPSPPSRDRLLRWSVRATPVAAASGGETVPAQKSLNRLKFFVQMSSPLSSVMPPTDLDDPEQPSTCYDWGSLLECRGCPACGDDRLPALVPLVEFDAPIAEAPRPPLCHIVKLTCDEIARGFHERLCSDEACAGSTRGMVISFGNPRGDPVSWSTALQIAGRCERFETLYVEQNGGLVPCLTPGDNQSLHTHSPLRNLTKFVAFAYPGRARDRLSGHDMVTMLQAMPSLKSLSIGEWDGTGGLAVLRRRRPFELDELVLGPICSLGPRVLPWLLREPRSRPPTLILDGSEVPAIPSVLRRRRHPGRWPDLVGPVAPWVQCLVVRLNALWGTEFVCGGGGVRSLEWASVDELRLERSSVTDLRLLNGAPTKLVIEDSLTSHRSFQQTVDILRGRQARPPSFRRLRTVVFGIHIFANDAAKVLTELNILISCVDLERAKKYGDVRIGASSSERAASKPGSPLKTPALEDVNSTPELLEFRARVLVDLLEQGLAVGVQVELINLGGRRTGIGFVEGKFCFV